MRSDKKKLTTRREFLARSVTGLSAAAVLGVVNGGCGRREIRQSGDCKKMLILGYDGMDYRLVDRLLNEGRLPNMAKLSKQGGFRPLTTSIPPQSPVAWANFITGAGPGVHGIFDFIHRDPSEQTALYLSTSKELRGDEPLFKVPVGDYRYSSQALNPWANAGEVVLMRKGTPFWEYLDERGIPVQMYRLPSNYPPTRSKHGNVRCLAGLGVPDALGNQGTYQHFSTRRRRESTGGEGYKLKIRRDFKTGAYVGKIHGPPNECREGAPVMTVPFSIYPDPERDVVKIVYVNEDVLGNETVELVLNAGKWSEWQELYFLKTPVGPAFRTMVRILLQQVRPSIELYVSPLNFIPTACEARISEPEDFVKDIGEANGPFYTQGFAEEFNALKHELFTDEEYYEQARYVLKERLEMLEYALDHYEEGLLFFYFSSSDLMSHMFWWDSDDKHPTRNPEDARKYQAVVEGLYVKLDRILGQCMRRLGDDTTVIVMSDHGFCRFRRCFALNTWLQREGYLDAGRGVLYDADWSKTRAYGMGLNGLYLNLQGREKYGIVTPAKRNALLDELAGKLLALRDPESGKQFMRHVYRSDACYSGPEAKNAPDLIIGCERDYRVSWNTCLGDLDKDVVFDNEYAWAADHCMAQDVLSGVLLSNRRILVDDPSLIDVAPSVLARFGIARPGGMTGRSFF